MHAYANPTRFLKLAKPLTPWLLFGGIAMVLAACAWGILSTPPERLQGDSVKIIFVHVPMAWLGMAGWTGIAIASISELIWRHPLASHAARAIAVPGALFALLCLVTGSLWGRPAWGTWWVWDGRLTSMLVLFFLYLAYIVLANETSKGAGQGGGQSRIAAIFGVVGIVNLPIIRFSVEWWETQHQGTSISIMGKSTIDALYLWPLLVSATGFSLLFGAIVLMRMRASLAQTKVEARLKRMTAE
ncbi:heme ABC transporter permease CcmC [Parasphingorhabdus halotolerans]|uniref:Heme exporter protein C n=1 Tax=Parasphingorhabdus halotolerans TaxID=2725558 RepID=A0A6H2DHQ0_9SPHN|nr:heme ABC transporter permease CcmC [Parasphingorhabdus halotolerans]QJB67910.1 cytochrome c biogenesis protein CcsA [Parasphingorhabdus halotolerans]